MEHRDVFLLETILEYCNKILFYIKDAHIDEEKFREDFHCHDLCSFYIFQIGEYAHTLSASFRESHPEIKWHRINGLRNLIAHNYGESIDLGILWNVVVEEIPKLRDFCAGEIGVS